MIRVPGIARFALVGALVLGLGGCKTVTHWFGGDKQAKTETLEVAELYAEAKHKLDVEDYSEAQQFYTRLVARFPYGPYSEQAQLEIAYAQFKLGKREDATSAIDRFIRTYPRNNHIDYAYYLKAVINFDRDVNILTRVARMDMAARDLTGPTQSYADFNEVILRYPNSRYAVDARQRMVYLRNQLARHEMKVGLYYWHKGAWLASANRGKFILENYPQSQYQNDAVALMAVSYDSLGEKQLAADARLVLQKNNPEHPLLSGNWPSPKGILRKLNPFAGELN